MDAQADLPHAATGAVDGGAAGPAAADGPRLGEVLGALSRALDLAEGLPSGHALRSCWIGQQVGRAIGLGTRQMRELYYAALLKDAGGSGNAARVCARLLTDDLAFERHRRTAGPGLPSLLNFMLRHAGADAGPVARVRAVVDAVQNGGEIHRELAEARGSRGAQVARQVGLGEDVADAIQGLDEHWDGSGQPQGLAGREIPLYSRILLLAQAVDAFHAAGGPQATREAVARRGGRWFEPRLADAFAVLARDPAFWRGLASDDLALRVLEMEPAPQPHAVDDDTLDDIAAAFGQVVDAKSPYTAGHGARVALVADQVGTRLGLAGAARRGLRRLALLHDLGMLGVSNRILDKPGPLDARERAAMRRHALQAEQILGRVGAFGALARGAGAHHERLDGGGYPRGLAGRHIGLETRIVTVADAFDALLAERPWRAPLSIEQALRVLHDGAGSAFDPDAVAALARSLDALGELSAFGAL
jgi:HD-GYP domain-containing protein (c-di-GMP phosphodiesterase class II)